MEIKSFEDLEVWKLSKDLIISIYGLTETFPRDEVFGITNQMKRAAVSMAANIAEGFGRYHYPDRIKFYLTARGSLLGLKSHLLIATDLKFPDESLIPPLIQDIDTLGVKINNFISVTRKNVRK